MGLKIVVADDHKIIREGLLDMINSQANMAVIGEAQNGREAVRLAEKFLPDIVIMDISMPDLNGIEATRKINEVSKKIKVLALSMHSEREYVEGMLQAGACGYLVKDCAFEEVVQAIHTITRNKIYLSPGITNVLVEECLNMGMRTGSSVLTSREREILQLLAEGMSTKEIAAHLNISVKTIETHRRQIMTKTSCTSIAELTKYAIKIGVTSL